MSRPTITKARLRALPYSAWRLNLIPEFSFLTGSQRAIAFDWYIDIGNPGARFELILWNWIFRGSIWFRVKP